MDIHICNYCMQLCDPVDCEGGTILWCSMFKRRQVPLPSEGLTRILIQRKSERCTSRRLS
jgi:hypothetical protein